MQGRDRLLNLAVLAAALVAWVAVWLVVTTRDPTSDLPAGYLGAGVMGLAVGLTSLPLFWLIVFARHRRIAYRGDWFRAGRRALWVGLIVALFVVMRLLDFFSLPVALFVIALVLIAEVTLSIDR